MNNIKKLFAAAIICTATFLGYNTYKTSIMTEEERLIQANLEALSDDNEQSDGEVCYDSITTKDGVFTRYCGTCSIVPGEPLSFSGKDKC